LAGAHAGFGLFWLFTIQGSFPFSDLSMVAWLWPLLLVAAGLDLMVGRRFPWLGALIAALMLAGFIWISFNADRLQINTSVKWIENWDIGGNMFAGSTKSRSLMKSAAMDPAGAGVSRNHPGWGRV
jgi:predicted membrane metal-binding protein